MPFPTLFLLLLPVLALVPGTVAAAPDTPALMVLNGRIAASDALQSTAPQANDQVLVFNAADQTLVGSGPVSSGGGDYVVILGRTASFNGTPIVLELMQGNRRYQLLQEDGQPAWLRFRGLTLPERTLLNLRIGAKTAELLPDETTNPQAQRLSQRPNLPCDASVDINGDGRCDDEDWAILKLFGGGVVRSVARP